jgi:hypothetical protein
MGVGRQPIRSQRIVYGDAHRDERAMHVAKALGIHAEKIHTITFTNRGDERIFMEVNNFACRAVLNGCSIRLSLEEVTAAFVKLKKLGYEVVRE